MHTTRRRRRTAATAAIGLVGGLLAVLGPAAAPAYAATCTTEAVEFPENGCDDTNPPDTTLDPMRPAPNAAGYISVKNVSFTFSGRYDDGDTDPIRYECQFYGTISAPTSWDSCTSPAAYPNLADTTAVPYTFRVRAVDSADVNIVATCGFLCTTEDAPDFDQTPAQTSFDVDTVAPNGDVQGGPYDEQNDVFPMATSREVEFLLSPEGDNSISFRCKLNGQSRPCTSGETTLRGLTPGDKTFSVVAVDQAGNADLTPATSKFSVPRNLTSPKDRGWQKFRGSGYFNGDYLQSDQIGAQVSAVAKNASELRLIAPTGPRLGKVEIKIGPSIWRTVNLNSAKYRRFKVYYILDRFAPETSGRILIRVKSLEEFQYVRIDAVHAH